MKKIAIALIITLLLSFAPVVSGCNKNLARSSYDIEIALSENVLTGRETVTFYNNGENTVSQLKFNLFANAFRKGAKYSPIADHYNVRAYPNGESFGSMEILTVLSGGKQMQFEICGEDQNVLLVQLDKELYPEERIAVDIEFKVELANVVARTGINAKTVNLANFYPILCAYSDGGFYECVYYDKGDPFFSDCADYKVKITANKEYVIASSGKLVSSEVDENAVTREYVLDNARSFAFVLCSDYQVIEENFNGVGIYYYYYADKEPEKSVEFIRRSLTLFNEKFGEYPYPTYTVTQTEFLQGGMEFPALVMISDDLEGLSYGEVIVHETAHQWWQTVVGNNEIEFGFLDEGLAEYSVVLFYENYPEYGYSRKQLIKSSEDTYRVFCSVHDKLFGSVNTVMKRPLNKFNSEYEYVNMAYVKPCIMYDYLRTTIGDERFFTALKKYYKNYKFLNATPDDLVGAFEKVGADSNGFFESFFDGKVII
jgi:archaellum component FlaF (FlaF/FlaG flagellin family)